MEGTLTVEKSKNETVSIVFLVKQKEDVNQLTMDLTGMGLDVLYEPRNIYERYESCILCNETTNIKIIACQNSNTPAAG